jgi:leader peptidase (prepilin peptidase) / N-methyltransferase
VVRGADELRRSAHRHVPSWLAIAIGFVAVLGLAVAGVQFGWAAPVPAICWLAVTGLALAAVDVMHRRLPNALVAASGGGGLALLLAASERSGSLGSFGRGVLSAVAVFVVLVGVMLVVPGSLGGGDVKFGAVLGMYLGWFGWQTLIAGFVLAVVLAGGYVLVMLMVRRSTLRDEIPLGPSLTIGALAAVSEGALT